MPPPTSAPDHLFLLDTNIPTQSFRWETTKTFISCFLEEIDRLHKLKMSPLDRSQSSTGAHLFHVDDFRAYFSKHGKWKNERCILKTYEKNK